jgi:hypothetical protein
LSVKNAEAERLAKERAREKGTTVSASVIDALEQALRRARGEPLLFKGDDFARTDVVRATG